MASRGAGSETMPDVRDLRAFCQVVDLGSLTAAASMLGETKGSISRRLTRLERDLGVSLLRRSPRRVQPTEDGLAYRTRVGRVLELLDDANAQARGARDAPRGHLRVTAPNDLAVSLLAPIVARFVERFPAVTLDMLLTERLLDFDAEQIDIAFRASKSLEDSALVAHRLRDFDVRLFASRAYLKKHGAPVTPADLATHRVLVSSPVSGQKTVSLRRVGEVKPALYPVQVAMSANFFFVREIALAGAGLALLPSEIVVRDLEQGRLVPVLTDHVGFSGALFLVHRGARFLVPKVQAFRDHVLGEFGKTVRRARG